MTPDASRPADRAKLRAQLIFSWGGNPGVGSLRRFRKRSRRTRSRRAQPRGHGQPLRRGRVGPAFPRGYSGTSLPGHTADADHLPVHRRGPADPALDLDVAVIHAQGRSRATQPGA
jgi:glutaconate CoA-transferase subunit A